jgi:hypothetical protein
MKTAATAIAVPMIRIATIPANRFLAATVGPSDAISTDNVGYLLTNGPVRPHGTMPTIIAIATAEPTIRTVQEAAFPCSGALLGLSGAH